MKKINRKKNKELRRKRPLYIEKDNGIFLRVSDGAFMIKGEGWVERSKYRPDYEKKMERRRLRKMKKRDIDVDEE